jgi:hypothetical protein
MACFLQLRTGGSMTHFRDYFFLFLYWHWDITYFHIKIPTTKEEIDHVENLYRLIGHPGWDAIIMLSSNGTFELSCSGSMDTFMAYMFANFCFMKFPVTYCIPGTPDSKASLIIAQSAFSKCCTIKLLFSLGELFKVPLSTPFLVSLSLRVNP